MHPSPDSTAKLTRRQLAAVLGITPLAATQVTTPPTTQKTPPVGAPAPSPSATTPEAKLQKAVEDVRQVSQRLSALEVPMDMEPAFVFRP